MMRTDLTGTDLHLVNPAVHSGDVAEVVIVRESKAMSRSWQPDFLRLLGLHIDLLFFVGHGSGKQLADGLCLFLNVVKSR